MPFVALSNLSATSYQLWSPKTLFTAVFFVACSGASRLRQWAALALLTKGVGLVQIADASAAADAASAASSASVVAVGVAAVLASSLLSGFANIYFEKVLRRPSARPTTRASSTRAGAHVALDAQLQLGLFAIPGGGDAVERLRA